MTQTAATFVRFLTWELSVLIWPLGSGLKSALDFVTKGEWNGKEAQPHPKLGKIDFDLSIV